MFINSLNCTLVSPDRKVSKKLELDIVIIRASNKMQCNNTILTAIVSVIRYLSRRSCTQSKGNFASIKNASTILHGYWK